MHGWKRGQLWANLDGQDFVVQNILRQDRAASEAAHTGRIDAPLHGRVIDVLYLQAIRWRQGTGWQCLRR